MPLFKRMLVIFLENQPHASVPGDSYLRALEAEGVLLRTYFGVRHPSEPNYVAAISGSTFGIDDDADYDIDATTIVDLLEAKGVSWKGYMEGLPAHKLKKKAGRYVRKHNPFVSFRSITSDPGRLAKVVNANQFAIDLASGVLPEFCWYTPDLDNDGHDTDVAFASEWLRAFLSPLLQDQAFRAETLVVVTFDERHPDADNHVHAVVIGPGATPGTVDDTRYDHYSILRTAEQNWSLGTLGRSDQNATWFSFLWGLPPTVTTSEDHN